MTRLRKRMLHPGAPSLPGFGALEKEEGETNIPNQTAKPEMLGKTGISRHRPLEILTPASGFVKTYDFTINPYSGCSFACTYCYAAFFPRDQKKRDTWGQWVSIKENAPALIARRRPGSLDGKSIYMSTVTDPYQPIERKERITRGILEELAENHRPRLVVQTRSPIATRDTDLFRKIQERGGRVQVNMTVTTDDEDVRRAFEPGCPSNMARLKAVHQINDSGVQTCITMTPLLTVREPEEFAQSLLDTGCQKFIIQTFHFEEEKLIAQTRQEAFTIMARKLKCPQQEFRRRYAEHYRMVKGVLAQRLPHLGEGRQGFAPPF